MEIFAGTLDGASTQSQDDEKQTLRPRTSGMDA